MLTGNLTNLAGHIIPYQVTVGLDKSLSYSATLSWNQAALSFLDYVNQAYPDPADQNNILEAYGTEDAHWNWMSKSLEMTSPEYVWFYLEAGGEVQAIAITYHPKTSQIDTSKELFYIEYLAVAPWNRRGYLPTQQFKGAGSLLISILSDYFPNKYGYPYGFALHSLPQACSYYLKIGMQDLGSDHSKNNLHYFEMSESE